MDESLAVGMDANATAAEVEAAVKDEVGKMVQAELVFFFFFFFFNPFL